MRPALLRAYRNTRYEAAGIQIRIGIYSAATDRLLLTYGARIAAIITAYNPRSRLMPLAWNRRVQADYFRPCACVGCYRQEDFCGSGPKRIFWYSAILGQYNGWRDAIVNNAIVIVRLGQPPRLAIMD